MKTIIPLDRQSLLDVAIQAGGGVEAALDLSIKNDASLSEPLAPGAVIEAPGVVDPIVLSRYAARNVRPATGISPEDIEAAPFGGIGFMGIEIDFIVS
ncbi:MAG: hypothetical protein LBK12_08610 [Odoribacteraceae bacterium]|jgi:hypothetical protein|nr:hypothetical protein [Odoribacteraceae bacterium]